jgi:eukaryotic-like serine/threonine-protein kinase
MLGRSLRQYQLLSVLGIGGTGEVYCARDCRLERDAAVKVLHAELVANCERLRRFEREAQTASSLNHPNVVTIYEVGEADQCHFVAMELVAGETVRTIIGKRPSLHDAISICTQIAQALHVAHAADIVHRDIKPENIMLQADGYVKVLDFGLARLLRAGSAAPQMSEHASSLTHPGMLLGTLRYMSPEQARGEQITSATDIFSLGIVLFELATGQHPFPAKSAFETLQSILSQAPLPPSRLKEQFLRHLKACCFECLRRTRTGDHLP